MRRLVERVDRNENLSEEKLVGEAKPQPDEKAATTGSTEKRILRVSS